MPLIRQGHNTKDYFRRIRKMAFTALDVKKLREMTNVGMMDCKAALTATDGDMDKAVD